MATGARRPASCLVNTLTDTVLSLRALAVFSLFPATLSDPLSWKAYNIYTPLYRKSLPTLGLCDGAPGVGAQPTW